MRNRLHCWLSGHDWLQWPAWTHAGRGKFYRQRFCRRCHKEATQTDA